jgi:RNA polymerase sigma-70 factor (ECF subfamily)
VEAGDVVQSAYKSLSVRYAAGDLDVVSWNSLWGLLTLITVRKCAERAAYHWAGRRDAAREVAPPGATRRRRGRNRSAASRR